MTRHAPHRGRPLRFTFILALASIFAARTETGAASASAETPAPEDRQSQGWIERSNENAKVLLDVMARFAPEEASEVGVSSADEQTMDIGPDFQARWAEALRGAAADLRRRLEAEHDRNVRQDLEILIEAAEKEEERLEVEHRVLVPYVSAPRVVFQGIRTLLDDETTPERRGKAIARLARYAGLAPGATPLARLAEDRFRERAGDAALVGPYRGEVEKNLADSPTYVDGVRDLFRKYKIAGHEEALEAFENQVSHHDGFMRTEVLGRARSDYRLPAEIYALDLKLLGVDMPIDELDRRARVAFQEIQNEMQALAPLVAKEKGWRLTDYRDVIRRLKKKQLVGGAILPLYQRRIRNLEEIIRREGIATLPVRDMKVELASEAESADVPSPHFRSPRLIGNVGERAVFVLPLNLPASGGRTLVPDDDTFEAASWTLAAHEGRPGHELQFARMVEKGVSLARAVFAETSVNLEGWALYAEAEVKPYEPVDGQLIALQNRLLRAARSILDPGLQSGAVAKEEAARVLLTEVCLSEATTGQEIDRYTFEDPGQATSYFVGYSRLLEIRSEAEIALGPRFDRQKFNDFILGQGTVPPRLLRRAVEEELVPALKNTLMTPAARPRSPGRSSGGPAS